MKTIWILAEARNGRILPVAEELAGAARQLASTVEAVGWGGAEAVDFATLGTYDVSRVFRVGDLGDSLVGPRVAAAVGEMLESHPKPDAILVGATYDGRDVAARLSAKIDVPVLTNVIDLNEIDDALVSTHAVFGGTVNATARFTGSGPGIFVVRPKSFERGDTGGAAAEVVDIVAADPGPSDGARVVSRHVLTQDGPSLDSAEVVVAGGRGLGSKENYRLIEELAHLVHGAPGASRAIVDAGWVPYSHQVGQTGKTVKPEVYLAFGISGATQHLVGMKDAKHIIAVDRDPSAPIFRVADLGVVGDLAQVLPKLIEALRARGSHESTN